MAWLPKELKPPIPEWGAVVEVRVPQLNVPCSSPSCTHPLLSKQFLLPETASILLWHTGVVRPGSGL